MPKLAPTHQTMKSLFLRTSKPKLSLNRFNLLSVGFLGRTDLKVSVKKIETKLTAVRYENTPFTPNAFRIKSVKTGITTVTNVAKELTTPLAKDIFLSK